MTRAVATILCGMATGLALFSTEARAEKRVALVIGNGAYLNASKLANPSTDAAAVATMFRDAGFEVVETRADLGNLEFKRVTREFSVVARDADIAVLFYAGHGVEVNGTNYLIPVDAKLATDFDVEDEALSLDRVMRALEPARRLRLVILDACRDNPFARNMRRTYASRSVVTGLAKVEPTQSDTLIAYATRPGNTADDGIGANSPFTTALLKHLTVPGRDVRIALGYTRDEVLKATGARQEPFVSGSLGGATVALVPDTKAPEVKSDTRAQSPASGLDPRRDYEFAERVGTREAWDSFLSVHRNGFYSDLARAQRDKLVARIEPKVPGVPSVPSVPSVPGVSDSNKQPGRVISVLPAPGADKPDASPAPEKKPNIAVLPPPGGVKVAVLPPAASAPQSDLVAVTRELQGELRRVGCDPGAVNGKWSEDSRDALGQFNRRTGMKLDVQSASVDAVDAVKGQRGRICPLVCGRGQRADGEQCIAIPAPPKAQPKKQAVREPAPRERARERARRAAPERRVAREAPARHQPAVRQEVSGSRPDRSSLGAD